MKKNILIIGANSFIAKGISSSLGVEEYNFLLTKRKGMDVRNEESIIEFISTHSTMKFDAVLFCQGINPDKNTKESTSEHITEMLQVNIMAPILILKHLHPYLNDGASVLFFSSIAATKGSYDPAYAASKSAIYGLIQSLANEFSSIRFNAVVLGLVENSPVYNKMTPDFRDKHSRNMFNGKFITVEHIAKMVKELLSNESINRSLIPLTGGYNI